ncbi:hypothetical protein AVEN_133078-1 [Araneus ventricosus]|uniref:Uncharacterized protein n=1 Tax=Araneus ventricosus TaxID=182803 RepID=A0A4Y2GVQ1_ARAVE|nr:hypothetical protein AVEN_133078-1 [Araneus ventricosus]
MTGFHIHARFCRGVIGFAWCYGTPCQSNFYPIHLVETLTTTQCLLYPSPFGKLLVSVHHMSPSFHTSNPLFPYLSSSICQRPFQMAWSDGNSKGFDIQPSVPRHAQMTSSHIHARRSVVRFA